MCSEGREGFSRPRLRLASWRVPADLADDILLSAVELVGNACDATPAARIAFRARRDPATGAIWVGARDTCRALPTARLPELTLEDLDALPDDHAFGGWGLPSSPPSPPTAAPPAPPTANGYTPSSSRADPCGSDTTKAFYHLRRENPDISRTAEATSPMPMRGPGTSPPVPRR
ncbi:hypothetical protein [Actinocorallia libanotica]|uniref:Histidine kinase-like protein n=1 Tax=Actinocorallia libanotica TaxID=46162 RepID=A0ABN1RAU8_9ACTN